MYMYNISQTDFVVLVDLFINVIKMATFQFALFFILGWK